MASSTSYLRSRICVFAAGCILSGCGAPESKIEGLARPVRATCDSSKSEAYYFAAAFDRNDPSARATAASLTKLLSTLNEPSLSCGETSDEGYRLIFHRWSYPAQVIRIARTGEESVAIAARAETDAEGDVIRVLNRVETRLTQAQWENFRTTARNANLWYVPTLPLKFGPGTGTRLHDVGRIVEGRADGLYHVAIFGSS